MSTIEPDQATVDAVHAAGQLTTVEGMTPDQVTEALEAGRLTWMLTGKIPTNDWTGRL